MKLHAIRVYAAIVALLAPLVVVFAGAPDASAVVVMTGATGDWGTARTGLATDQLTVADLVAGRGLMPNWQAPAVNGVNWQLITFPQVALTDPRGWFEPGEAIGEGRLPVLRNLRGYWGRVRAGWSGNGVELAADGHGTFPNDARFAGRLLPMRIDDQTYTMTDDGRSYEPDHNDPRTPEMDQEMPPFLQAHYAGRTPEDASLTLSLLAHNLVDNCWYERNSLPGAPLENGLSRVPIAFTRWTLLQGQVGFNGIDCRDAGRASIVGGARAGVLLIMSERERVTTTSEFEWRDGAYALQSRLPAFTLPEEPVGITSSATKPGDFLLEWARGTVVTFDPEASRLTELAMQPASMTSLPIANPDSGFRVFDWRGDSIVLSLRTSTTGPRLEWRQVSHGVLWVSGSLGSPAANPDPGQASTTSSLRNAMPSVSTSPLTAESLADTDSTLFLTVRTVDGQSWQHRYGDAPGWYRVLGDSNAMPPVVAPTLRPGEAVQSWQVASARAPSGKPTQTHILFVKTDQRVLGAPLTADSTTQKPVWQSVSPGGAFPATSDRRGMQVGFNGDRQHVVVVNDDQGTPVAIPINDSEMGACVPNQDAGCKYGRADAPWRLDAAAVAAPARFGDVTHLAAPPTWQFEPQNLRTVVQGISKTGRVVQNVLSQADGTSGWYVADTNAGSPAIGGYVAAPGRIASTQQRYSYGSATDYYVRTAWTRLDGLPSGGKAVEIHLGGVARDHTTLLPTSAFGAGASGSLLDSPAPALNPDESVTLFAPTKNFSRTGAGIAVAHFDPETERLTGWATLPGLTAGVVGDTQLVGATSVGGSSVSSGGVTTSTGFYTVAYRNGSAHTLGLAGVRVTWRSDATGLTTPTVAITGTADLGGDVTAAPAVMQDPANGQVVVAVPGRDGLYFQRVTPNADGSPAGSSGYTSVYQLRSTAGTTLDTRISPNVALDEFGLPQVSAVDRTGQLVIGFGRAFDSSDHGMPAPSTMQWDARPDQVAGRTTVSAAMFAPAPAIREVVMTNPNNGSIDFNQSAPGSNSLAWTYTVDPSGATKTGNASPDRTNRFPEL